MKHSNISANGRFPRVCICTVLAAAVFAAAALAGVRISSRLFEHADTMLHLQRISPYTGCDLAVEYAVRAARLCRPVLFQLLVCWLAAYVHFERWALCFVFAVRGLTCGMALHLCILLEADTALLLSTLVYACISVIFLMTVFHIRTETGLRPLADSITALLIAGGACCTAVITASLSL